MVRLRLCMTTVCRRGPANYSETEIFAVWKCWPCLVVLRYGPFRTPIWPISRSNMAYIGSQNGLYCNALAVRRLRGRLQLVCTAGSETVFLPIGRLKQMYFLFSRLYRQENAYLCTENKEFYADGFCFSKGIRCGARACRTDSAQLLRAGQDARSAACRQELEFAG